jgi:hypothetical protein
LKDKIEKKKLIRKRREIEAIELIAKPEIQVID